MSRERLLGSAYELIVKHMRLRRPQAEALESVRDLLLRLPRPLHECSPDETEEAFRSADGWEHRAHPRFTLDLATGVGKSRLAGSIMALLWLTKEAQTFLLLAPRRAVLRRLNAALDPTFREYIFVEPKLVPEPLVIREDEIESPVALERQEDLLAKGPRIYLLSPQLIAMSRRFSGRAEFADASAAEVLKRRRDLVVISDEAHHFGASLDGDTPAWTKAVDELRPALEFGLTATVRQDGESKVLYRYPLPRAIADGYTKKVQILVRQVGEEQGTEEDLDHATVDYALKRLEAKEAAVRRVVDRPPFPGVKPVAVLFAADTEHAESVYRWLIQTNRATEEQVLVVHSKRSETDEQLERLLNIEKPDNPVRIVINVAKLTEGWDVTNVYVIAPLRAMATFTNAVQAMGRGLRLPAGRRVGDKESDTLDLLCFGRETLQQIIESATKWSGGPGAPATGIQVKKSTQADTESVDVAVPNRRSVELVVADVDQIHPEIAVGLDPRALRRLSETVVNAVELAAVHERLGVAGALRFERDRFVRAAASRTIRQLPRFLSDERHDAPVRKLIEQWLDTVAPGKLEVLYDPAEVGDEIANALNKSAEQTAASYKDSGRKVKLVFPDFQGTVEVPSGKGIAVPKKIALGDLPKFQGTAFEPGVLYQGWKQALHPAYTFDSRHEALLARLLDQADVVKWWVRNEPRRLRIPTPLGAYHPDFVAALKGAHEGVWLLEVKGDIYWEAPEGEARLKARAANAWCKAQTDLTKVKWRYAVVLESDLERDESLAAVLSRVGDSVT